MVMATTLEEVLDAQTREGALYDKLDDNKLRCYACGHRCVVFEGHRGICKVRFNEAGKLRVPWGYVAGLQSDPTEKKPFFHVLPGSETLTFGMLGCDYHCPYCFTGDTPVVTNQGVLSMEELFEQGQKVMQGSDGDVAVAEGLQAVAGSGKLRPILKVFRHRYTGPLTVLDPYYLPPLRCTPDHRVYATTQVDGSDVQPVPASEVTTNHYLAIPRHHEFGPRQILDVYELLQQHRRTHDYYLIPLRSVAVEFFEGEVYNLEVEEEHNYLANFFLVKNCQNWLTSQALRDPNAGIHPRSITPEDMAILARRYGARVVASSYNEPLITAEWAADIFKLAREAGLRTAFVSNGNATREVLEYLQPWTDCYKIDLKSMSDKNYRYLGGVLDHVLKTIEMVYEMGFWMEIVTLVVPGWNDSDEELRKAAEFIAGISTDIPWHVTAFHKNYKMHDPDNTTVDTLLRAAEIGRDAGLNYVYAGNLPGRVGRWENTYCPNCDALLVERYGYLIRRQQVTPAGHCPDCGHVIAGIWGA
ncbi:MAG: radical SAM protein [Anaerolineae bacterium]